MVHRQATLRMVSSNLRYEINDNQAIYDTWANKSATWLTNKVESVPKSNGCPWWYSVILNGIVILTQTASYN